MKPLYILFALLIFSLSCKKNNGNDTPLSCGCDVVLIDRMQFMNWDNIRDTLDLYLYDKGNNFTTPTGSEIGHGIREDGTTEGVVLFAGGNTAKEYKMVLRHHNRVYKLRAYTLNTDKADCSSLNDSIHCFNSFSFMLNDSLIQVPMRTGNAMLSTTGVYTLQLY